VLVLGAGGPVGRAILDGLCRDPRLVPVAGLRRPPARSFPTEIRLADTADPRALDAALEGCALAVNAIGGPPAGLARATQALCAAAARAGLRRLVHVSSIAVHGGACGLLDETAPFAARPSPYERGKIDSEAAVAAHGAAGHGAVTLRAGLVFGPGSAQWAHRIARLLRAGRLGDLGAAGDGFCNLTHEADLAAAVIAALLVPDAAGRAFNLAPAVPPTWNAFLVAFARALGATPVRRIARHRLALEARVAAPAYRLARLAAPKAALPDAITPALRRLFAQRVRFDPARADGVLAVRRTPDEAAVSATAAALRA
jgi:nucleoside-diphosphate-sugar epimerase